MKEISTKQQILDELTKQFKPEKLEVIDDGANHKGHANEGQGHYTIKISAPCLSTIPRITSHRLIYSALQSLMPAKIHALKIEID